MTIEQFVDSVIIKLGKIYDSCDYDIRHETFTKNNDTIKHGIVIQKRDEILSPTIYVEHFYENYHKKKCTIAEITEQIQDIRENVKNHSKQYEQYTIDFESCKKKIVYRLISQELNEHLLEEIPYLPFLNLAIIFSITYELTEQGLESIRISNELMDKWGCTTEELMTLAQENTKRLFPLKIDSMENILFHYIGITQPEISDLDDSEDNVPMLIISNKIGINGASAILYEHVIEDIAEKYNSNLFILPSSIHEVIVMPDDNAGELSDLSKMVQDINAAHVTAEEILSNNAYFYCKEDGQFFY